MKSQEQDRNSTLKRKEIIQGSFGKRYERLARKRKRL